MEFNYENMTIQDYIDIINKNNKESEELLSKLMGQNKYARYKSESKIFKYFSIKDIYELGRKLNLPVYEVTNTIKHDYLGFNRYECVYCGEQGRKEYFRTNDYDYYQRVKMRENGKEIKRYYETIYIPNTGEAKTIYAGSSLWNAKCKEEEWWNCNGRIIINEYDNEEELKLLKGDEKPYTTINNKNTYFDKLLDRVNFI